MATRNFPVAVTEPVSNSPNSVFNRYELVFREHVFDTTFDGLRSRRRIMGTLSGHLIRGQWTERLDFTTRDGTFISVAGGSQGPFGLPFDQWQGWGQPSFTETVGPVTHPPVGGTIILPVRSTDWMAPGAPLFIDGNTYLVVGATGPHHVNVRRVT